MATNGYGNYDETFGGYNQGDIGNLQKFNQERQAQREQQQFNPMEVVAWGLFGGFIGMLIDMFRGSRRAQDLQPGRAAHEARKQQYLHNYEAWDREYGDKHRAGLPCPSPPSY